MIPVYTRGIEDLTIARYIATREVQFAGFKVNRNNKTAIKEIIGWIEGPYIIIEVDESDFIDEVGMTMDAHYIHDIVNDDWIKGNLDCPIPSPSILQLDHQSELDSVQINTGDIYIDCKKYDLNLVDQLNSASCGLVIYAGTEESVGIKSFDELDDLFDRIENLD
jgi:hypothetical protein